MFKIGDAVIHPAEGVCEITEIAKKTFSGKTDEYYVLKSVYDSHATVYIPVETVKLRSKIRRTLSSEEVNAVIDALDGREPIKTENDNQRRAVFKEILTSGNPDDIAGILKTLHLLKKSINSSGKKMKISDERIIKETESSVFGEFAFSLGIKPSEIPDYIKNRLKEK